MVKFATFQDSNLLLFIVAPVVQRRAGPPITLIVLDRRGGLNDQRQISQRSAGGGRRFLHQGNAPSIRL